RIVQVEEKRTVGSAVLPLCREDEQPLGGGAGWSDGDVPARNRGEGGGCDILPKSSADDLIVAEIQKLKIVTQVGVQKSCRDKFSDVPRARWRPDCRHIPQTFLHLFVGCVKHLTPLIPRKQGERQSRSLKYVTRFRDSVEQNFD